MGLIVSLLSMTLIKKLIETHYQIDGKWFRYLQTVLYLRNRRKQNKTNRVVTHDFRKDDMSYHSNTNGNTMDLTRYDSFSLFHNSFRLY